MPVQTKPDAKPDERRTQVERRAAAEGALLDAAAELFAERGAAETSLAQIGERAGYSRGLANHHFGSKSELIERLAQRVQAKFTASLGIIGGESGLETILTIVRAYLSHAESPSSYSRALLVMWGVSFAEQSAVNGIAEADERSRLAFAKWIEGGQADGSIRSDVNPVAFSAALIGLLRGVTGQCLTDAAAVDLPSVQAECEQFVRVGLSPTNVMKET